MKYTSLFLGLLRAASSMAQTAPSDSLFNTDQVVTVNITFADPNFWTTLTTYYANDLGETLTGSVSITDLTGTYSYDSIEVDLKGNSTYSHPGNKKSFKIDFNDNIGGQKYHGMRKVHFNNCWNDPTFMREKLFFDYCQEQGVLAPRVNYANIYMNGTFWGFYDLVEAVDKDFLDRHLDDTAGNLFKAADNFQQGGGGAEADLLWYGADQASYYDRYELKTNETANDWSDLVDLLDQLNNADDAFLLTHFPVRWKWNDLLRSLAMDNMYGNLDSYINSARNYYLYHDSSNTQWNWIHWDANMAFGSYPAMGQNAITLSPTYVATNRPLMTRIMGIPELRTAYLNKYCSVHENFNNTYLDPRIDSIATLIQPYVLADVNKQFTLAQFTANIDGDITVQGGGGGGQQTIRGLKSFILARNNSLDGTLDCTTAGVAELAGTNGLEVFPNPATDAVNVVLPSGAALSELRLLDALGRYLPVSISGGAVQLTALSPGIYVLRATYKGQQWSTRFEKR